MIIDCHGHYTTAPKALEAWRNQQIAGIKDPAVMPRVADLKISDDELRESIETNQLRLDEGARQRHHAVLAARQLHGAPHRRLQGFVDLGGHLQRALLSRQQTVPSAFRAGRDAAAVARRGPRHLHSRTGEMRQGIRQRRHQPESRSVRRPLDQPAAFRPALVPDLRKDGGVRHPGDDPRQHQLQPGLPHHRRALPERGHDGLHAVPHVRPVQGVSDAALPDPARRRRGAVPLGALSRPGAGTEEAAAVRAPAEQHLLRHLRVPPARHRPAEHGDPGEERAVRLRDDRRRARHRSGNRQLLRRHQSATSRPRRS